MTANEALERLLPSYIRYYDILREDVEPPFAAEARFHSHGETYVLVKSARISEADSHEYVYFYTAEELTADDVQKLCDTAWERGMSFVKPHSAHRNSDVTVILLADRAGAEALDAARKMKRSQSYRFGLQGWSVLRVVALETSSGTLAFNRQGQNLKKLFRNIIQSR